MIISQDKKTMIPLSSIAKLQIEDYVGLDCPTIEKPYFVISAADRGLKIEKYSPEVQTLTAFTLDGEKEMIGIFKSPHLGTMAESEWFRGYVCNVRNSETETVIEVPDFRNSCEIYFEAFDKAVSTVNFSDEMSRSEFIEIIKDLLNDYKDYFTGIDTEDIACKIYTENFYFFQKWKRSIGV